MGSKFQRVPVLDLATDYEKVYWALIQLTLLVIYNDGLCSLCYPTNLLKDCCLACISSSYDKNAKAGTSVVLPKLYDTLHICICIDPVKF